MCEMNASNKGCSCLREWLFTISSSIVSGIIVLLVGAMIALPAYNRLINVVQMNQSSVQLANSPNAQVKISQVFQGLNEMTNPQTIQALPTIYRQPLENLRKASEDVVSVLGNTSSLNKPVGEFKNAVGADIIRVRDE